MPVRNEQLRYWTIYRINLEEFTGNVFKQMSCTEEEIKKECKKIAKFVTRNDLPSAYIYREDIPRDRLVIPVL